MRENSGLQSDRVLTAHVNCTKAAVTVPPGVVPIQPFIPSVDLQKGRAVQLQQGKELLIDGGDPRKWMKKLSRVGEVAVVDIDAAKGVGSNREVILELLQIGRCRVGGGIRDADTAKFWLDVGATKIVMGTAACADILSGLPRDRVVAALDTVHGEVVTHGWTNKTGTRVLERMMELAPYVGGFLVTFVEREGGMEGIDHAQCVQLAQTARNLNVSLTIAGGIASAEDIANLDAWGCESQVGMAIYSGKLSLGGALAGILRSDRPDGLWPTAVCTEAGVILGITYTSLRSLEFALEHGVGAYESRSRHGLWVKGETSGHTQELLEVSVDCDRDALRFHVKSHGPFCHGNRDGCFGNSRGLYGLEQTLHSRMSSPVEGSYTKRLLSTPGLLKAKLGEEAQELAEAETSTHVAEEAADLFYFAMVRMQQAGVSLCDVEKILDRRALKVMRRPGDAKVPLETC